MVNKEKPRLLKNTSALLLIQLINYISPLLLIPYLTRTLGAEIFGVTAIGISIVQIACTITDYGFNLSATQQIAESNSKQHIRETFYAVIICKILILIPVFIALSLFIELNEQYSKYQIYFWLLLIPIAGQTFQPIWLFQGIERMGFITIYSTTSRAAYLLTTVLFVKSASDYYLVAITNGISTVLATALAFVLLWRIGYSPVRCSWKKIKHTFSHSTQFFWARAAVATYTAGGAFFLGIASTPLQVAYYSAAEQIYKGAQSLIQPVSQALYPYMIKNKNIELFKKILIALTTLSIIGACLGALFSKEVIELIFGNEYSESKSSLLIFLITFCVTTPSILLGYPFLGALGFSRTANLSVILAGVLQLILLLCITKFNLTSASYVCLSILTVEITVLAIRAKKSVSILNEI
ncbi:oligosaccharide flippase family protein [Pseudomonas sp. PDM22]|uniref:oligosaccharide flippase family protein n=1 Tax=Pseudomonas sp. PDM22 TaxID=2769287 RepID=UPI00177D4E18|nr:oligosaccharide flippase family protein [Pseudomonas sp. PDM22]MBD9514025.1 oligosaccharide flippase family protein [Pseudomonas sp. PDM22]